ncbi:hypothetical protein B0H11DRAFT_1911851 [Mycena galericulata]|nr:hypothetical protein B0H11DRAFT_1911851 [Mycena galericulata]
MPAAPKRSSRHYHTASSTGLGKSYSSPSKPRDSRKRQLVVPLGHDSRLAALTAQLSALQNGESVSSSPQSTQESHTEVSEPLGNADDEEMAAWEDVEASVSVSEPPAPVPTPAETKAKRSYISWRALLPQLVAPLGEFRLATSGQRPPVAPPSIQHTCVASCTGSVTLKLNCLYISRTYGLN